MPAVQVKAAPTPKTSTVNLEPKATAIVGNRGTAIATPVSRAILKEGSPTVINFKPHSVAISGVGGRSHAAADFILDIVKNK